MKNDFVVRVSFALLAFCCFALASSAKQTPILLWPEQAHSAQATATPENIRVTPEGDHVVSNIQSPSVTPYLPRPEIATGAAVVIAPGGGHRELWIDHEGYAEAEWLSSHGVAAFVLKYRLAKEANSKYTVEGTELADVKRALRIVRARSKEWNIDPQRIGVMGFSAGGELAALASTRYDEGSATSKDPVEQVSSKPNFLTAMMHPGHVAGYAPASRTDFLPMYALFDNGLPVDLQRSTRNETDFARWVDIGLAITEGIRWLSED